MIWYVDIEHEKALADPRLAPGFAQVRAGRTRVVAEAAGLPGESILYREASLARARANDVRAITISGNTTDWEQYDFAAFQPLFEIVTSGEFSVIGFCGGHQLIGLMYGMECGPIRRLRPGEADPADFAPGWFKEMGYQPVQVIRDDPLFAGLGQEPVFFESHYWEIKALHPAFELLASTKDCRVQAMRHRQLPIYGVQFHPEVNMADHEDGRRLLKNFFRLAL